ncbi:MAG TPA: DUF2905 domain-containing protein [Candidatus Binataceae bacterium]|nr:DUF2905 domain-containing protein [Candidatus Binataceae bacterium]
MAALGKSLVGLGVLITIVGLVLWGGSRVPWLGRLGRLPGDIYIQRDNFSFYFPVATSILISVILSLILRFLIRR